MSAIALAHRGGNIGQDDMTGHFFSIPVDSSDDATSGGLGNDEDEYKRTQNLHSFFNHKPLTVEIPVNNLFFENQSCSPTDVPNMVNGSAFIPSQPQHLANLDPNVHMNNAHGDSFSNQSQMQQHTHHNRSPSFTFDNKRSPIGTPAKVSPAPSEGCGEDTFDAQGSRASWPGVSGFHTSPRVPPMEKSTSDHVLPMSPFDANRPPMSTSKSSPSGSEEWWDASSLSVGSSPARLGYSLSQSQQNILQRAGGAQREWDSFGMQQQLAEQVPRRNQEPIPPYASEMSLSSFALGGGIFGNDDNQAERRGGMRVPMMSPMNDQFNEEEMFGRMEINDSVPPSPPPQQQQPLLSRSLTLSFSQQPDEQMLVSAVNSFGACRVLAPAGKCTYTVSYFDLRSASNCIQRLQNMKLGEARVIARFLDDGNFMQGMLSVHNVASTVQNFELMQLFRNCGDVQDVLGSGSQRIVSFFDLRHVRAASTYHGTEIHGQPISLVLPGVANLPSPLPSPFRSAAPSPSSQPQDGLLGLNQHSDGSLMEPLRASRQLSFPFPSSPPSMQQPSQSDIPSLLLLQQQQEFESQQMPYQGINSRVLQMQQQQLKQQIRRGLMQATGSDAAAAHGLLSIPPVSPQMQSVSGRGPQCSGGGGGTPQRTPNKRSDGGSAPKGNMFLLDLDKVRNGEDRRTTLMIRNIPNKYSQKMLLSTVDEKHKGTYDFLYLPIDFKNKCNVGYAFINFIYPSSICSFHATFNHRKWDKFNSDKVCELAYARIQGKQALISHFQNSSLMTEDKKCRPLIFFSEGPNQGTYEPFPVGPNVRRRADGRLHDEEEGAGPRK